MKPLNIRWSWIALLLTYFFLGIFLIYHYQHSPHVISTITDQELLEGSKPTSRPDPSYAHLGKTSSVRHRLKVSLANFGYLRNTTYLHASLKNQCLQFSPL
ncbi:unnamed protein product, partial [Mesorhabditis spiculigera]